ncbi:MAG: hypothetical protein ABFC84_04855 [Veillonellales bacterium]
MRNFVNRIKKLWTRSILQDTFNRDILTLVVVSIVIGSLLATTVSLAANAYFSKALASLVGDYGEYDIIIQAREEVKEDTALQIQKVIDDAFPGAKMKEGPTITGKTSFFVALPEQYKTKQTYEDLSKTFGSIPGGAGVGVLTEPRLTIRGVPEGAKNMLMDRISQIDGVRFVFHDGASIGVVLSSLDKASPVDYQIKEVLKQYQVIEISFPVGSEPSNPIRMGEAIASDMQDKLKLEYAKNVSVDGKNDDMTSLVSTMMELKRFLTAYATQVVIVPSANVKLTKGDKVAFQGTAAAMVPPGAAPDKGNVLVQITGVRADGTAEGIITQGEAAGLGSNPGYKLINNVIGEPAGTATYSNPRQQLGGALTETSKLVSQIPGFAQDTQNMSNIALGALDNYGRGVNALDQTLSDVQTAGNTIQAATSGLANIDTSSMQVQIDNSSRAVGGLINTLQVVKLVNGDVADSISGLTATRHSLESLKSDLSDLDNVSANARRAQTAIDAITVNGHSTIAALRAFDVNGARNNLNDANNRLNQLQQLNVPLITTQLQYMAAAAPNLKDEDISNSINLMDQFIAGQVIPGQRIQILTTSNISTDAVAPIVYNQVGHNQVSLYSTALGVIEPNPRGELYQVLNEVRAILAGMTAIIATILFLALDHTAIMTIIRRKRLVNRKAGARGWRGVIGRIAAFFTAPERQYGMMMGAVLLTAMFIIARGGIPYLPWIGVPVVGGLLGLIVAGYAEKISPLSAEEVMAGESLGLSFDEIMREIVIPAARPGLLQKLNSRKVKFK